MILKYYYKILFEFKKKIQLLGVIYNYNSNNKLLMKVNSNIFFSLKIFKMIFNIILSRL